jgi:hypothetical protein
MLGKSNTQYTIYGTDGDRPPEASTPAPAGDVWDYAGLWVLEYEGPLPQAPCALVTEITIYGAGTARTWRFKLNVPCALPTDAAAVALAVPLPPGLRLRRVGSDGDAP